MSSKWLWACLCVLPGIASAEAVRYTLDPDHTFPSFEADHLGISTWRGKFTRSRGHVVLDRAAGTGSVEVEVEVASISFGLAAMDEHAHGADMFDAARFPRAHFRAQLTRFVDGAPTQAVGTLELHGVTQPVTGKHQVLSLSENSGAATTFHTTAVRFRSA